MKKLVIALFTTILTISFSVMAFANASVGEIGYYDDEPYVFPIQPGSPEWSTFKSKDEMLAVSQIPEGKLKNMTTRALLETVTNYPLINDFLAFNTVEDAYNTMLSDFNGFSELFRRSDGGVEIISKYQETRVLTASEAAIAEPEDFFGTSRLEYLFACNNIAKGKQRITSNEYNLFRSIYTEKQQQRDSAGIYSSNTAILTKYENENKSFLLRTVTPNYTPVYNVIKTPKGNYVAEVYVASADLTATERTLLHNQIAQDYPLAVRIGDATTKYNCHSYAWYSASTSNRYWINNPATYLNDGSYYQVSGTPRSGMKIHYYNGDHSAISIGAKVENGLQTHWAKSKWGMCALYEHYITYSPYASGTRNYSLS